MANVKNKGVRYTEKYWFARGYYDKMINLENPPSSGLIDYFLDLLDVDVSEEYKKGMLIGQRDKINGLIN